jgi:hypothetical protein
MLDTDVIEALQHVFEQANLSLVCGRKVCVTVFGTVGNVFQSIAGEK